MRNNLGQFIKGTPNPNKKVWIKKICPKCQTCFEVKPSLDRVRHCSFSCARRGTKHTEEQKLKIKLSNIGKHSNPRPSIRGDKNYRWIKNRNEIVGRHNRSFHDSEYKQWVLNVRNRDNWKCKISNGDCSGRLETHHILGWKSHPKLRYEVNNGITLCHFHHPRKRNDEMRLSPYFQELIKSN